MGMSVPEIFPYLCPVISAKEHAFIGFENRPVGHDSQSTRTWRIPSPNYGNGVRTRQKVEVVLNAPLRDPIVYKIMDYEVSLRRSEAHMVVVITNEEAEG